MIDRSIIGEESEPYYYKVDRSAVEKFYEAIGNHESFEHLYKQKDSDDRLRAPLTFPTTFRAYQPEWYEKLDRSKLLHAEQEYIYERRIYVGDVIKCVEKVTDIYKKQGRSGKLTFIVREKKSYDENDELIFTEIQTLVVRE